VTASAMPATQPVRSGHSRCWLCRRCPQAHALLAVVHACTHARRRAQSAGS
jgi:hypothetical protein